MKKYRKSRFDVYVVNVLISDNAAPSLIGPDGINITVGETQQFTLVAEDPENTTVTFNIIALPSSEQFNYVIQDNTFTANFTPNSISPMHIE